MGCLILELSLRHHVTLNTQLVMGTVTSEIPHGEGFSLNMREVPAAAMA